MFPSKLIPFAVVFSFESRCSFSINQARTLSSSFDCQFFLRITTRSVVTLEYCLTEGYRSEEAYAEFATKTSKLNYN